MENETIVYEIDARSIARTVADANANVQKMEDKTTSVAKNIQGSFERMSDTLFRLVDKQLAANERLVKSIERRAEVEGKTPIERIIYDRDRLIRKLGDEQAQIDRVTAAAAKLIEIEKKRGQGQGFSLSNVGSFAQQATTSPMGFIQALGQQLGPTGVAIAGVTTALAGLTAAGYEFAKSQAEVGIRLKETELRLGTNAAQTQAFDFAAKAMGQDLSVFDRMMRGLTEAIEDNSSKGEKARKLLFDWKVSMIDWRTGAARPMADILPEIATQINKLPDPFARSEAAMTLFKRAGIQAIPVLEQLNENLDRASTLPGFSQKEIDKMAGYQKELTEVDRQWTLLKAHLFEPISATVLVSLKWLTSGTGPNQVTGTGALAVDQVLKNLEPFVPGATKAYELAFGITPKAIPKAPQGPVGPTGGPSEEAKRAAEELGIYLKRNDSLEAAQRILTRLKSAYEEAATEADKFAHAGAIAPEVAKKQHDLVESTRAAYRSQDDIVKELQKDESRRVALLERQRDLIRENNLALTIGRPGQFGAVAVSREQLFEANRPPRAVPSLFAPGERPSPIEEGAIPTTFPLPAGISGFGANQFFVSPEAERAKFRGFEEPTPEELKARGAGVIEREKQEDAERLNRLQAEASATAKILELRTGPGGEFETARQVADVRQRALEEEFKITGDITKFREQSLHNQIDLVTRITEIQHKQTEEVEKTATSLTKTLFEHPKDFGKQFGDTISQALLSPIEHGIGRMISNAVSPIIFGPGGTGGFAGLFHGAFGDRQNPIQIATELNSTVTQANTAATLALTSAVLAASGTARPLSIEVEKGARAVQSADFANILSQLPSFATHFSSGGIVDKPTLGWLGESGLEMVLPLGAGALARFIGSDQERKAKRIVKDVYGVNIDRAMADGIVSGAEAKHEPLQQYVREPDVRKMIELLWTSRGWTRRHEDGGMIEHPEWGWTGEAGSPEALIPFGARRGHTFTQQEYDQALGPLAKQGINIGLAIGSAGIGGPEALTARGLIQGITAALFPQKDIPGLQYGLIGGPGEIKDTEANTRRWLLARLPQIASTAEAEDTLIAARKMISGKVMTPRELEETAVGAGAPIYVPKFPSTGAAARYAQRELGTSTFSPGTSAAFATRVVDQLAFAKSKLLPIPKEISIEQSAVGRANIPGGTFQPGAYVPSAQFYEDSPLWRNWKKYSSQFSSADPRHVVLHELGHYAHHQSTGFETFKQAMQYPQFSDMGEENLAGMVSEYAKTQPLEFVAETYSGLVAGKRYNPAVLKMYGEYQGAIPWAALTEEQVGDFSRAAKTSLSNQQLTRSLQAEPMFPDAPAKFADGGIVDQPTWGWTGEAGKEARIFLGALAEGNPLAMRQAPTKEELAYQRSLAANEHWDDTFLRSVGDLLSEAKEAIAPGPGDYGPGNALNLLHAVPLLGPAAADVLYQLGDSETRTKALGNLVGFLGSPASAGIDPYSPKFSRKMGTIIPPIQDIAHQYAADAGIEYRPPSRIVNVDPGTGKSIALLFEAAVHSPADVETASAYAALKKETLQQYLALQRKGITLEPWGKPGQPYDNSAEMLFDLTENKHLSFFRGGDMPADHPMAEQTGVGDLNYNDMFRAVHDAFAHGQRSLQFGPKGEENAWIEHMAMFSPEAQKAVTTETRGQNSWVNFGPFSNLPVTERPFAEQKAFILPKEYRTPPVTRQAVGGLQRSLNISKSYLGDFFADEEGALKIEHYGRIVGLSELDPAFSGTGKPGAEAVRRANNPKTFLPRIYAYEAGAKPEVGLGVHKYVGEIDETRLYDLHTDPLSFRAKANDLTDMENAIRSSGYMGYKVGQNLALFEKIPVTQFGAGTGKSVQALSDFFRSEEGAFPSMRSGMDLKELATWGAARLTTTTKNVRDWSKQMLDDFGESIKPDLNDILDQSEKILLRHKKKADLPKAKALISMYEEGKPGADWYKETKSFFQGYLGEDTDKFIDFLAATSPNQTVPGNVTMALRAFKQWKSGEPFKGYMPAVITNLNKAVLGEEEFGGPKVTAFRANLHGDPTPVTVDRWVSRAFGFGVKVSPEQYKFMDYAVTQLAEAQGVEPRQMQAAIWNALKEADRKTSGLTSESFEEVFKKRFAADPTLLDFLKKPKEEIPSFATGGTVWGPTLAMVGENGPERITPLGQSSDPDTIANTNATIANTLALYRLSVIAGSAGGGYTGTVSPTAYVEPVAQQPMLLAAAGPAPAGPEMAGTIGEAPIISIAAPPPGPDVTQLPISAGGISPGYQLPGAGTVQAPSVFQRILGGIFGGGRGTGFGGFGGFGGITTPPFAPGTIPGLPNGTSGISGILRAVLGQQPSSFPISAGGATPPFFPGSTVIAPGGGPLTGPAILGNLRANVFNTGSIALGRGGTNATTAAGLGGVEGALAGFATSPAAGALGSVLANAGIRRPGAVGGVESTIGGALVGTAMLTPYIGLGPAALAGGGIALAAHGLSPSGDAGTFGGTLEGAAGGAAAGFAFGGPLGAAIGGAIGLGIGLGEQAAGVEPKWKEAERLVWNIYKVRIDKAFGQGIAQIAIQKYTGHVSMAVRDPEVRKDIELYAAATGQKLPLSATTPRGMSLVEQQGQLFQEATYQYGRPYVQPGGLPILGGIGASIYPQPYPSSGSSLPVGGTYGGGGGGSPNVNIQHLSLSVGDKGAADFFQGNVTTPDLVAARWADSQYGSTGRVQNSALMQGESNLITG